MTPPSTSGFRRDAASCPAQRSGGRAFAIPEAASSAGGAIAVRSSGTRAAPGSPSRLECFRPGTEPQPGAVQAVQLVKTREPEEPSSLDFMRSDF